MAITIEYPKGAAPLYCRYPGQTRPQRAFVEIFPEWNFMAARYTGEIDSAVPERVRHGRVSRIKVSPYLSEQGIRDLLDRLRLLAERIVVGYKRVWDGNSYVGRFDDSAASALLAAEQIAAMAESEEEADRATR